jgi:CO/xanthine dehydrogenase Mo-binding subunit
VKKLLTGRAAFVDDVAPHGLLHAALVSSPHPHARITSLDVSAARSLPGVVDVITHEAESWPPGDGPSPRASLLLSGVVSYVGGPAAIVVAEDPEIAGRATEAVRVTYDPLPAVLWTTGHREKQAPAVRVESANGDLPRAFREAEQIVEVVYHLDRSHVLPPEPPVALAWLDEDGHLVVRSANVSPLRLRLALADALGVAGGNIRVERPEVGGDFGARGGVLLEMVSGLVTLRTGRPCRFALRPDHPAGSVDRGACSVEARASLREGAVTGIEMRLRQDLGQAAPDSDLEAELRRAATAFELYPVPALRFEAQGLTTHAPPAAGAASIAVALALEALVDAAADAMNEEPPALRRRLLPGASPRGGLRSSLERCLREVATHRRPRALGGGILRQGFGVALARSPLAGADAAASVARNEDDSFSVSWGPCQASTSASGDLQALAARGLGVPVSSVTVNLALHVEPPPAAVADLWITARAVEAAATQMAAKLKAKARKGRASLVVHAAQRASQAPVPEGAFAAEVLVDTETGVVRLVRLIQAVATGAAEPLIAAQAEGDALRGASFVLFEHGASTLAAKTRMKTPDLPDLSTLLTREGRPRPLGALPLGDVAFLGAAAAVANAVARACGTRLLELPLTPERVLAALEAAGRGRAGKGE